MASKRSNDLAQQHSKNLGNTNRSGTGEGGKGHGQTGNNASSSYSPINTKGGETGSNAAVEKQSRGGRKADKKKTSVLNQFSADLFINIKNGSFAKDYTGGKVLGEGAYGKVCLVTHKKTGIVRAMKAIKKSSVRKDREDAMLAEVAILKSLDHPNIVKLYELYQDDKYYYLVTE